MYIVWIWTELTWHQSQQKTCGVHLRERPEIESGLENKVEITVESGGGFACDYFSRRS